MAIAENSALLQFIIFQSNESLIPIYLENVEKLTCKSYGFPALTKKLNNILVCAKWTFSSKNPCKSSRRFGLEKWKYQRVRQNKGFGKIT